MKLQSVVLATSATAKLSPFSNETCDRALLQEATNRYIAAQSTGQPQWLSTLLSDNVTLVENNIKNSIPETCTSFSELISVTPSPGYQIGTQLRLNAGTRKITRIDHMVTMEGDLDVNTTQALHYLLREDWAPILSSGRNSRATIQAAADAYYTCFSNGSTIVSWDAPCDRFEGGTYIGQGLANDTCDAGLPPFSVEMRDQRYVADETIGSVNILSEFGILGPDSHEFRVEKGKIRWIYAMMFCRGTPNCDAPEFPGLREEVGW
ncbi:hypothetical protein F5Y19DRAFT_484506 [Xylariaceae sp. FL1651]|nr:hypothetical protein F5Y19DRAFT_484506 [Xylariaceae sp. FL1651]